MLFNAAIVLSLLLVSLYKSGVNGNQVRLEPEPQALKPPIAKAAIVQSTTTVNTQEQPTETARPSVYTSQGYVVRIMKAGPVVPKKDQPKGEEKEKLPELVPVEPVKTTAAQASSSVYLVKRPVVDIAQPAPRPTTTMGGPKPIVEVKPTITGPKPKPSSTDSDADDDDDEAEVNTTGRRPPSNANNKTTTVQSGDPWGDFVFPTRGPRPHWLRNEARNSNLNWSYASFMLIIAALPLLAA